MPLLDGDLKDRRLSAQFALSRILATAVSLHAAAPQFLKILGERLGCVVSELWLLDRESALLTCHGVWIAPGEQTSGWTAAANMHSFARGQGLPGRVLAEGTPAWTDDVASPGHGFLRQSLAAELGLHAAVAFPIQFAGETTGVIQFFYRMPSPPDAELLELFADVGGQLGLFVERTRMDAALMRQAREIVELSTPVLSVWDGVLAAPVIGPLEGSRAEQFMDRLLTEVERTHPRVILLDVTGVPAVDTHVARHLSMTAQAVGLLGAEVVLTGISPRVASTLAKLGVSFDGIRIGDTLADGLRQAIELVNSRARARSVSCAS